MVGGQAGPQQGPRCRGARGIGSRWVACHGHMGMRNRMRAVSPGIGARTGGIM